MKLLDACLALVLTLAIFASAATVLVELLQRAWDQRRKQLRTMLGLAFDRFLAAPLAAASADIGALRARFVAAIAQRAGVQDLLDDARRQAGAAAVPATPRLAAVEHVTVDDLLRRLARSTEFQAAFARLEAAALRPALERLVAGFAHLEADATALFAARARLLANLCGIFLALAVNVDAVRIFDHYARDPAGTARTIVELAATLPPTAGYESDARQAEMRIAATLDDLRGLAAVGVPVGWGFFPYCTPPAGQAQFDPLCKTDLSPGWRAAHGAFWLLCACVTGLLIGLGGPFWFDLATALGQWRELLRGLAGRGAGAPTAGRAVTVPPAPTFQAGIDAIVTSAGDNAAAAP
jgi:hypothetical protein